MNLELRKVSGAWKVKNLHLCIACSEHWLKSSETCLRNSDALGGYATIRGRDWWGWWDREVWVLKRSLQLNWRQDVPGGEEWQVFSECPSSMWLRCLHIWTPFFVLERDSTCFEFKFIISRHICQSYQGMIQCDFWFRTLCADAPWNWCRIPPGMMAVRFGCLSKSKVDRKPSESGLATRRKASKASSPKPQKGIWKNKDIDGFFWWKKLAFCLVLVVV